MAIVGGGLGAALGVIVVPWLPIGARVALALLASVGGVYSVWSSLVQADFLAEKRFSAQVLEAGSETGPTPLLRWASFAGTVLFVFAGAALIAFLALWMLPRVTGSAPW